MIAHDAILRIARADRPDLWKSVRPDEASVWQSACHEFDGRFLPGLLEKHSLSGEMPKRLAQYNDTRVDFKEWLQDANTFEALCCSAEWYFNQEDDEAKKVIIEICFWRGPKADEALISSKFGGGYDIIAGEVLVLFRGGDIDDIETSIAARRDVDARRSALPTSPTQTALATEEQIRTAFKARVEGWPPDTTHPSEEEDIAAIEASLGRAMNRGCFRKIRREIAPDWIARGRPRKTKSAEK